MQLEAQLGPNDLEQVLRRLAPDELEVAPGALRQVQDVVVLTDHDRRRRIVLEQALMQLLVGDAFAQARLRHRCLRAPLDQRQCRCADRRQRHRSLDVAALEDVAFLTRGYVEIARILGGFGIAQEQEAARVQGEVEQAQDTVLRGAIRDK